MDHTEIRVITSAKGGVGKSTVCVGLGIALARRGKRVLLIDCDMTNHSLDLMLGLADRAIFGLSDVLCGTCDVTRAILSVPTLEEHLFLLPAGTAMGSAITDGEGFRAFIRSLCITDTDTEGKPHFDHILIDTPGGNATVLCTVASPADEALIVSSAQESAIRSAETTAALLDDGKPPRKKLIINAYRGGLCLFEGQASRGQKKSRIRASEALIRIVDTVALPLLGVVPFSDDIWERDGAPTDESEAYLSGYTRKSAFTNAFSNIAARLSYKNVPLFSDNGKF